MDYKGQRLSEYIYSILTILFGGVAWVYGYIQGDFQVTFYGWAAGLALALLVRLLFNVAIGNCSIHLTCSLNKKYYSCVFPTGLCITEALLRGWKRLGRGTR